MVCKIVLSTDNVAEKPFKEKDCDFLKFMIAVIWPYNYLFAINNIIYYAYIRHTVVTILILPCVMILRVFHFFVK